MRGKNGGKSQFLEDLTGRDFNRLTVIEWLGNGYWLCRCACGNKNRVKTSKLKSGHTKSCGCLHKEINKQTKNVKHGFWNNKFSKGTMKFYLMWQNIKARCNNPNLKAYKNYGGRGITYDPRWNDFLEFKKDMYFQYLVAIRVKKIKNPSIERKDVNGNYCKENCTFITFTEQLKNQRTTRSFIAISPEGKEYSGKNVNEFCKKHGLNSSHVYYCLDGKEKQHKGWKFKKVD